MRSNEYYNRPKVLIILLVSLVIYSILVVMSFNTVIHASVLSDIDFTPNFNKGYRKAIVLDSLTEIDESDTYNLSDIDYDINTLYLDWSGIEAERARIKEEVKNKVNTSTVRPDNSLRVIQGSLSLPNITDTSFKGYMCMHKVTSKSSNQWKFLHSGDFQFDTDKNGILTYKNYYVVAMGSYYTNYKIGSTFRITLDSGVVFDVITGDAKADVDTDINNTYRPKGSNRGEIIEFLIACGENGKACTKYKSMSSNTRSLGNLSSLGFQGNVVKIEKIDDNSVINKLYG